MVEMMQRRSLEVLCVQETRWKGDRVRRLVGGYKLLHMGGDGRSDAVRIMESEEISKQMVRAARWEGRIIMARVVIQRQMVCVTSVYRPQTGRNWAEKQEFWDTLKRMMEMVELEVMLCIFRHINAHVGVAEPGEEECFGKFGWGMRNRED